MPAFVTPDGRTVYIPGVYSSVDVRSSLPGPLPAFLIPLIIGSAFEGHPFDADDSKQVIEADRTVSRFFGTDGAAADYFGIGSDVHKGMRNAKRVGLQGAYVASLSRLTRASVVVTSGSGAVIEFTLFAKSYGAPSGHIRLTSDATNRLTAEPVKRYSVVTVDASVADTRIFLHDTSWIREGQTVYVGSNVSDNEAVVVKAKGEQLNTAGQREFYIDLTAGVTLGQAVASYALVLEVDETTSAIEKTGAIIGDELIDFINAKSELFIAVKAGTFTGAAPDALPVQFLKDIAGTWGAVTPGTSPAAVAADVADYVTHLNDGAWEQFLLVNQVRPRAYMLCMGDSTSHKTMRDYATAERARGYPISVDTGVRWGDTVVNAGDDTDPKFRTSVLNHQDVALWANGLDREASFLSLAGQAFGLRIAGGIGHNLTNDNLVYSEVEKRWNQINLNELETLSRAGVGTIRLSDRPPIRYKVNQGVNTLQTNEGLIWNEGTNDTWSIQQRDLMDFVDFVIKGDLDTFQVGADEVNPNGIANLITRRAEKQLQARGYIESFKISSIVQSPSANGFDVAWSVKLRKLADYIGLKTTILIGE